LAVLTLGGQVQKLAAAIALAGVVLNPKGAFDAYNKILDLSANAAATASLNFDKLRAGVYQAGISANLAGNKLSGLIDQTDKIGTKVLPKAKEATEDWGDSLDGVKDTAGGVAKTIDETKQNLEKYTSALKSSTSAQKSLTNAQKANKDAKAGLVKADADLLTAQENFNRAVAGYGADSAQAKAAQRELSKAQRTVANAGFAVEESVFAVRDAELKLAELRADPLSSPQAIRQAEIDLAQAKLAVADASDAEFEATNGLRDAQLKLNEATTGAIVGSDTYNEFLKLVNDAKQAQVDASERLTEATERETEAFEALAEAIKKVADAAAMVPGRGLSIPTLPGVVTPTPTSSTVPSDIRGGTGANIVINTGIGTNGVEAGRQIVEVLQTYTNINRDAIASLVRR
jgi:chromosome segregation ATPase